MKTFSICVILLCSTFGFSQIQDTLQQKILSPTEMREDMLAYTQLLQETHPGLFRYQSEAEYQYIIDSINTEINKLIS